MTTLGEQLNLGKSVDRIYAAVLDPSIWSKILTDIVDRADGTAAMLLRSDIVSGEGEVRLSRHEDEVHLAAYRDYYAAINPLHNVADPIEYAADWQPAMLRDEDWLSREALEATEYYNDFLRPLDACHGLYLRLALDGRSLTTISVGRGCRQGRFGDEALAALAPLHGHLIRAANLSRGFAQVRHFAESALAALDAASDPLMLLDAQGRLVHANDAGEQLLSSGVIIEGRAGRLSTADRSMSARMDKALALATGPDRRQASRFTLADRHGGSAEVNILPIAAGSVADVACGPAILVRVSQAVSADRARTLMERFGLTASERAVALSLTRGTSLRMTADASGISVNTARRHLASIFNKTGVRRQVELVRLLTHAG